VEKVVYFLQMKLKRQSSRSQNKTLLNKAVTYLLCRNNQVTLFSGKIHPSCFPQLCFTYLAFLCLIVEYQLMVNPFSEARKHYVKFSKDNQLFPRGNKPPSDIYFTPLIVFHSHLLFNTNSQTLQKLFSGP